MIELTWNESFKLKVEQKEALRERYGCIRETSNQTFHTILLQNFGPIDEGDKKRLYVYKEEEEEETEKKTVNRKARAKA